MADKHPARSTVVRGKNNSSCIRCRRRKTRCDSARPFCTPCVQANQTVDCEYRDGNGKTQIERLEEQVAHLELRVKELEGKSSTGQPVVLYHPYYTLTGVIEDQAQRSSPISLNNPLGLSTEETKQELPTTISETLLSTFLRAADSLSFVLDHARFRGRFLLPTHHPDHPHKALSNAVCMWATRIHASGEQRQFEAMYLRQAIVELKNMTKSRDESDGVLHVIQAEILLAKYFIYLGYTLQARYHSDAAVSLAYGCGLHRISSLADSQSGTISNSRSMLTVKLSPARDGLERTERLNLFWAVFSMESYWGVVLKLPSSMSDNVGRGTHIEIPCSTKPNPDHSGQTLQSFLSGESGVEDDESGSTLLAKASAIYERVIYLSRQSYVPSEIEVVALAHVADQFAHRLLPLDQLDGQEAVLSLAAIHSITHASMIHLRTALPSNAWAEVSDDLLKHANEIISILELSVEVNSRYAGEGGVFLPLDPFLAITGSTAGHVLTQRLDRARHGSGSDAPLASAQQQELQHSLDRLIGALQRCAAFDNTYPIFSLHADEIRRGMT